jgi:hypothetical protein
MAVSKPTYNIIFAKKLIFIINFIEAKKLSFVKIIFRYLIKRSELFLS